MHRLQNISPDHVKFLKKQTEIYNDFIVEHSEVKVSQRCFEKLRPYYVKLATKKDQMSGLCRIHVEANMVFKAFMRLHCRLLGKQFVPETEGNTEATDNEDHEPIENVKIYQRLSHMVDDTLCPKGDNEYHKFVCLKRECSECGVQAVNF